MHLQIPNDSKFLVSTFSKVVARIHNNSAAHVCPETTILGFYSVKCWKEVPKNLYFSRFSTHNSKTSSSFNSISENIAYIETQNSLDYVEAIQIHFSLCFCGSKPLRIPKRTCFWKKELEMAIGRTVRAENSTTRTDGRTTWTGFQRIGDILAPCRRKPDLKNRVECHFLPTFIMAHKEFEVWRESNVSTSVCNNCPFSSICWICCSFQI